MVRLPLEGDYRVLHRARLIEVLAEGARQAGVALRLGEAAEPDSGGGFTFAADGLHSTFRAALNGFAEPRFTGQTAWRALIADTDAGSGAALADAAPVEVEVFMGPGRHLVSYPLPGGLRNIVAVEERAAWTEEGWHHEGDPAALRASFAGFGGPVPDWLARVDRAHLWALIRHPVAGRWHGDGVALLGDAAHPTLPFLAQGANMALEDAWVLADCVDRVGADGLAAYQAARLPRVRRIVAAAEANARHYHLSGARALVGHAGLRLLERVAPRLLVRRFDWLYRHDVTARDEGLLLVQNTSGSGAEPRGLTLLQRYPSKALGYTASRSFPMIRTASLTLLASLLATAAAAQGEVNLYSSRHYDTDQALYDEFTEATGIEVRRIEGDADELITRIEAEGANSPADVLITVDTSRLTRAKDAGILQPVESEVLEERIPANLQDDDNQWFGFSQRARVIFYDKEDVTEPPETYADLADPKYQGMVCIRSSTNVYNQTLLASIVEHEGTEAATEWAEGVVANMARAPQGGDTDQLRALVSGECDISVSNTYYFARAIRTEVEGLSEGIDRIGVVFPNQEGRGAHVNLSGAGVAANAPNRENAVAFLEYLASDSAQEYFSQGNDEYPAVAGVTLAPSVEKLGEFKADDVDLSAVADHLPEVQAIFAEAGWE